MRYLELCWRSGSIEVSIPVDIAIELNCETEFVQVICCAKMQ